ncbi:MAG: hypothetical protein A2Y24_06975 [Clostridiales bacterium GWE2_32_10]|nr:MAG: hypothetical protein A2Y24_06975 [Clostridiales bacterium GWE2_32_10]HBY19469.1 hypothetical protein [Clostridiales bacterium]
MSQKGKITVYQAMLLFITATYTPAVRLISSVTSKEAKQAAWLTPFISFILFIILIFIIHSIYRKYKDVSFMDAIYDIMGSFLGKIIVFLYLITLIILLALYFRYFAERLAMSIYPHADINFFIIVMLGVVGITLRHGIVNIARMNEIILPFITVIFILLSLLLLPNIKIENLTPISYKDILPVFNASFSVTAIWVYVLFVFFIGDKIKNKEEIKSYGIKTGVFLLVYTVLMIVTSVGVEGYSIIARAPLSYFIVIRDVSIFGIIERVESILIATWLLSDFIIISVFSYIILELLKSLFNFNDAKPLVNVFIILLYFLTFYLAINVFELGAYSEKFAIPSNVIFGLVIPCIIWGVGKVRRKV